MKLEVTEAWIEEKAKELLEIEVDFRKGLFADAQRLVDAKNFVRSLVEELRQCP